MVRRSIVAGIGSYLPERVVSNAELAEQIDTSDEWIRERSGIHQRHIVADGEMTSDLAAAASRRALAAAGMEPDDIGIIVVATSTPDETFPATATVVQSKLGCTNGSMGFDVQAVCSGFVCALATADNFIKAGQADTALVVGAETFSKILDWDDRTTCVLFGDGAGALEGAVAAATSRHVGHESDPGGHRKGRAKSPRKHRKAKSEGKSHPRRRNRRQTPGRNRQNHAGPDVPRRVTAPRGTANSSWTWLRVSSPVSPVPWARSNICAFPWG